MGFYDNEVKRVCENCQRLLIMAVNSIFGKEHDTEQKIEFLDKEIDLDPKESPVFMDKLFCLDNTKYHLEFQLLEGRMAVRMYE